MHRHEIHSACSWCMTCPGLHCTPSCLAYHKLALVVLSHIALFGNMHCNLGDSDCWLCIVGMVRNGNDGLKSPRYPFAVVSQYHVWWEEVTGARNLGTSGENAWLCAFGHLTSFALVIIRRDVPSRLLRANVERVWCQGSYIASESPRFSSGVP